MTQPGHCGSTNLVTYQARSISFLCDLLVLNTGGRTYTEPGGSKYKHIGKPEPNTFFDKNRFCPFTKYCHSTPYAILSILLFVVGVAVALLQAGLRVTVIAVTAIEVRNKGIGRSTKKIVRKTNNVIGNAVVV